MIPWRNDAARYGRVSITLHWLGAASVLTMLATAIPLWRYEDDHPHRLPWLFLHGSIGMLLLAVIAARVIWHFVERQPTKLSDDARLNRLASAVHILLLLLLVAQIVTGPLDVWSGGFALKIFNWATIPSPFGTAKLSWHDAIGQVHLWCGRAVAALFLLHLSGVAKHVFYDGDDTLPRMIGMVRTDR